MYTFLYGYRLSQSLSFLVKVWRRACAIQVPIEIIATQIVPTTKPPTLNDLLTAVSVNTTPCYSF